MNKKKLQVDMIGGKFKINASSTILSIDYNKNELVYEVVYYESPFEESQDVYQVRDLYDKNEDFDNDELNGYTFYGRYWDKYQNDYFIILCKQIDRFKSL